MSRHVVDVDRLEAGRFAVGDDIAQGVHPHIRHRAARAFDRVPSRVRPTLLAEHAERYREGGEGAALDHVEEVRAAWGAPGLSISSSDDDIRSYAERLAAWVRACLYRPANVGGEIVEDDDGNTAWVRGMYRMIDRTVSGVRRWVAGVLDRMGVSMPAALLPGLIARVTSARWWVRKLRASMMRRLEGAAIRAGVVHVRAGVYCSAESFERHRQADKRNTRALARATATNEAGQEFTLEELSALGVANPEVRYAEMVTRARGVEEVANDIGWCGYFVTWTCPSRYHARLSPSGAKNPGYTGESPIDAQQHLTKHWAMARAKLSRAKVGFMGVRIAEPHHDGTPHWHIMIFCRRAESEIVRDVMRGYALKVDGDEPGAAEHRFKWEEIDYKRGSAIGYLLKYLTKNITGALDGDIDTGTGRGLETGLSGEAGAKRVTAWARTWGIRQFQFFGVPGVGPWRELRRVRELTSGQLDFFDAWNAADTGDWAAYTHAVNGRPVELVKELRGSIYPGESHDVVTGLRRGAAEMATRVHEWVIKWGGGGNGTKGGGRSIYGEDRIFGNAGNGEAVGSGRDSGVLVLGEMEEGGNYGFAGSGEKVVSLGGARTCVNNCTGAQGGEFFGAWISETLSKERVWNGRRFEVESGGFEERRGNSDGRGGDDDAVWHQVVDPRHADVAERYGGSHRERGWR